VIKRLKKQQTAWSGKMISGRVVFSFDVDKLCAEREGYRLVADNEKLVKQVSHRCEYRVLVVELK